MNDTDTTPGTTVEIEMADLDPAKFPHAVVVTRPPGQRPPNDTDRWVWVRYSNDSVVPVREHQVRVLTRPTPAEQIAADMPAPGPIPLDNAGLYAFIRNTPNSQRWLVATWLKRQESSNGWETVVDRLQDQVLNEEHIMEARADLRQRLAAAEQAVRDVNHTHSQLAGELYDIEYAEGGFLFQHYLEATALALNTAIAVNPCRDEKG